MIPTLSPIPTSHSPLSEWLHYIESIHPEAIELGLDRVKAVAQRLQLLPFLPSITVAGTNGKGSTVEMLSSVYFDAGYKVGAYTSPHLHRFNERIAINRQCVNDEVICQAFAVVEAARADTLLTYFEYTTLAALYLFKQAGLDLVVLEVGMGGRLDAVNIVDPILAIIVSIGKDHTQWLGDTLELIAKEKAGITRENIPVVLGKKAGICEPFIKSPLVLLEGREYEFELNSAYATNAKPSLFSLKEKRVELAPETSDALAQMSGSFIPACSMEIVPCQLPQPSQAAVLAALSCLQDKFKVTPEQIQNGFNAAKLPARFQVVAKAGQPTIILDVAHNPDAAEWLKEKIMAYPTMGQIKAVWSSLADKDVHTILFKLKSLVDDWYVSKLNSARSLDKAKLQAIVSKLDSGTYFDSIKTAFTKAYQEAHPSDTIVVFGSFHVFEEIMEDKNIQAIIAN